MRLLSSYMSLLSSYMRLLTTSLSGRRVFIAALLGAAVFGLVASGVVFFAKPILSTKVPIRSHSGLVRSSANTSPKNTGAATTAQVQRGILDNDANNDGQDDGIADNSLGIGFFVVLIPLLASKLLRTLWESFIKPDSVCCRPAARPG
jgi:hypothetical protein